MDKMKLIEKAYVQKKLPSFSVGDTIKILTKIPEGDKVRLHPFEGLVIAKKGSGLHAHFTVRKVSFGEGIERVFPLHCQSIERIEVIREGKVKRSKLYYIRGKIGKNATKVDAKEDTTK